MSLTLLKLVSNSDPGDADHVGGNDWDQMANLLNTFESGTTITLRRTDAAGDQVLEFGPNQVTGGNSWIDFHTSSGDGDYSTRVLRNSGASGNFNFIQSNKGGFKVTRNSTISTVGGSIAPLFQVFDAINVTDVDAQDYVSAHVILAYQADDVTDPFNVGASSFQTELNYGVSPSDKAAGSAQCNVGIIRVLGSGGTTATSNEVGMYVGWFNMVAGETCSAWYTDWNLQGSVAVQPGELSGINMLVNNYYNGSPLRRSSYNAAFVTVPTMGAGLDAAHLAATTYKMDVGVAIQGYAGTLGSPTRGYEVGLLIGGNNTNWLNPAVHNSKIGTGIKLTDIESIGIDLDDPATSASSPIGISVTTTTRTWDTFIDLSSGLAPTTAAIKLGARPIIGTTMKLYEVAANTFDVLSIANTFSMLRLIPNVGTVSSAAARGILRVQNLSSGANGEYLELGAYGTSGFFISSIKEGSGTYRDLSLQGGGVTCLTVTATSLLTSGVGHKFENYQDLKVITIPADPASGYGRVYAKAVDANNDGLYVKLKINGAVTEVQVA